MSEKAATEKPGATEAIAEEAFKEMPVTDLPEHLQKVVLHGEWPKSWEDDLENPGRAAENYLADWPKIEEYYDSRGIPYDRFKYEMPLRPVTLKWPLTELITMGRKHVVGQQEPTGYTPSVLRTEVGGSVVEEEFLHVPQKEVATLEAQGWEVRNPETAEPPVRSKEVRKEAFVAETLKPIHVVKPDGEHLFTITPTSTREELLQRYDETALPTASCLR